MPLKLKRSSSSPKALKFTLVLCTIVLMFQNCGRMEALKPAEQASQIDTQESSGQRFFAGLSTSDPLVVFDRDIKAAGLYSIGGAAGIAGAVFDGPIHPWRDNSGAIYFNLPHKQNYRVKVDSWDTPQSWAVERTAIFDSATSTADSADANRWHHRRGSCGAAALEANYDNGMWIFGFWSTGQTVYGVAHHEYYTSCNTTFNQNTNPAGNRGWVNSVLSLKSNNGGAAFLPKSYRPAETTGISNSDRLVVVPEPISQNPNGSGFGHYGFLHPSNIAKEGDYFYVFTDYRAIQASGSDVLRTGVVLLRTNAIDSLSNWEVFAANGTWQNQRGNFVGNISGIQPKIFFERQVDPYKNVPPTTLMAQSIHYHGPTKLWLLFGFSFEHGNLVLTGSRTLASPQFDAKPAMAISGTSDAHPYLSIVDHASSDLNFLNIGNSVSLYYVHNTDTSPANYGRYLRRRALTLDPGAISSTFGGEPRTNPTPTPTPQPSPNPQQPASRSFVLAGTALYEKLSSSPMTLCQFPSMEAFKASTGLMSPPPTQTESYTNISSLPGNLQFHGLCGATVLVGVFAVNQDLYYSNGAEYCYFPSLELYTQRTGFTDIPASAFRFPKTPTNLKNAGVCR